jgi:hypothetical protein
MQTERTVISMLSADLLKKRGMMLSTIIETLMVYNCRIGELLRLDKKFVLTGRFVIVKGSKGSADIIIRDRSLLAKYEFLKARCEKKIFEKLTYNQVYKCIKDNYSHLFKSIKCNKNKKVTHAFRYLNVAQLTDDDAVKAVLHHSSKRSNKYYTDKV